MLLLATEGTVITKNYVLINACMVDPWLDSDGKDNKNNTIYLRIFSRKRMAANEFYEARARKRRKLVAV